MITAIDHSVRSKLGISSVHYMIADTCAQYKNLWKPTSIQELASILGLSTRAVSVAIDDMRMSQPALMEVAENGSVYPTKHWYMAHFDEPVQVTTQDAELAKQVILTFNELNGTKYQLPNNMEMVKQILRASPKLTLDHFKSVMFHKLETWAVDDKMKEYNRPSTLFKSPKQFMRYLDDATMYWNTKANDSTASTVRD